MGRCYQESSRIFLDETEVLHAVSTEPINKEIICLANQTGLDVDKNDIDRLWQSTVKSDELMIFNVFYSKKMWRRLYLPRSAKTCNRLIQDNAAVNFQQILRRTSYSCRYHIKLFFHFFYCRFLRNCLKDEISL